jgi:5-methylcytosine-specific restriction enzyme A
MPNQPKTHKPSKLKIKIIDDRPPSSQRGYNSSWRTVRGHHLLENPLCVDCLKHGIYMEGTDVHHIKKLKDYPELRDVPGNLMTLCKSCHSIRTARGE